MVKWIKYVQNDILAMKLNSLVSMVKNIIDCKDPSKDGKIINVRPITKKSFANDSYKECAACGHVVPVCKVRGMRMMKNISAIPDHYVTILNNLLLLNFNANFPNIVYLSFP